MDEVDDDEELSEEDEPIRTVGLFLPLKEPVETLPEAVDRAQYYEAEALLKAAAAYTGERGVELEVTLGDTYVGDMKNGAFGRLVTEGLLGPWARGTVSRLPRQRTTCPP